MHFFEPLSALATLVFFAAQVAGQSDQGVTNFGDSDPLVTFTNSGGADRTYLVEGNSDNPSTAYGGGTSPLPKLTVPTGSTVNFHPGVGFVGAFSGLDGQGTRHEVNFRDPSMTWYNADMQFGMSNSTFGTTDGSKRMDGGDALAGEQDCLAKANSVWGSVDEGTQQNLIDSGFLEGTTGPNGQLTSVAMGQQAPAAVVDFYQLTAEFNGYIDAGSVQGASTDAAAAAADKFSYSVSTNKLTITAYD